MDLKEVLNLDCTKGAVPCSSKKRSLEIISEIAAPFLEESTQKLFECLLSREKMGSTGIGNGIAIPHGRVVNGDKAIAVLIQCEDAIAFDAIDNQPVDLLFALFVPENLCKQHLQTLAYIAQKMGEKQIGKRLRQAGSAQELYDIITE